MNSLISVFKTSLQAFTSSGKGFEVLRSVGGQQSPRTLYVLDASFNPPTKAHMRMATSAISSASSVERNSGLGLLLLLATQNADKGAP
jgi:nicotinamide-nucleotide adenylyltransferase